MSADFSIKSGNTAPALVSTLYDGDTPLNLSGATVRMRMRRVAGGTLVVDSPAAIVGDPTLGTVSYQWQGTDTAEVGDYEVEWFVTYAGGQTQTFPTEGYTTVNIEPTLSSEALQIPALPDYCWPIDHGCCSDFDTYSPAIRARADALAAQTMRMLTGYSVGGCPVTLRPCSQSCVSESYAWGWDGGTFRPHINGLGQWVNGCGCGGGCACTALPTVRLGGFATVLGVKVDGVTLPQSAYRVDNGGNLVRVDGGMWPACQDMAANDDAANTFSVSVRYGAAVDGLGAYAAGRLACEFAKACAGGKCALPSNVTQVTRQGITMQMNLDAFPGGLTGIREVDMVILRYNPHKLKQPSTVWSPDGPNPVVLR